MAELQTIGFVLKLAEPVLLGGVALWGVWLTGRRRRRYTEAKSLGREARLRMAAGLRTNESGQWRAWHLGALHIAGADATWKGHSRWKRATAPLAGSVVVGTRRPTWRERRKLQPLSISVVVHLGREESEVEIALQDGDLRFLVRTLSTDAPFDHGSNGYPAGETDPDR